MKRREVIIDLTALLDIILILFFSVLILNTSQILESEERAADYQARIFDMEEYLTSVEKELDDALLRLEALSEWDIERLELIEEVSTQHIWRDAVEQAVFFVYINVSTQDERRILNMMARPNINENIEIVWGTANIIINTGFVGVEINRVLDYIITAQPMIIMFDETNIRLQEFRLIMQNVRQFIEANNESVIRYSVYRGR